MAPRRSPSPWAPLVSRKCITGSVKEESGIKGISQLKGNGEASSVLPLPDRTKQAPSF